MRPGEDGPKSPIPRRATLRWPPRTASGYTHSEFRVHSSLHAANQLDSPISRSHREQRLCSLYAPHSLYLLSHCQVDSSRRSSQAEADESFKEDDADSLKSENSMSEKGLHDAQHAIALDSWSDPKAPAICTLYLVRLDVLWLQGQQP